jgi:hypothetical protein
MSMIERTCACGQKYMAREADLKRGWGKSHSKSCAARQRTSRERRGNHQIAPASAKYQKPQVLACDDTDQSWDAHKALCAKL